MDRGRGLMGFFFFFFFLMGGSWSWYGLLDFVFDFFLLNGFGSGAWLGMFFMFKICVNGKKEIPLFDLFFLVFLCYFLFLERDIKFEQKYLFTLDFNRGGLRKTNETYFR